MAEDPDNWDARDYNRWRGPFEEEDRGWNWWSGDHGWRGDHEWLSDDRDSQATVMAPLTFNRVTARDNAHTVQAARRDRQRQHKAAPSLLQVPTGTGAAAVAPRDVGAAEHGSVCAAVCLRLQPPIQEEPGPPPARDLPQRPAGCKPPPAVMSPGIHPTSAKPLHPPPPARVASVATSAHVRALSTIQQAPNPPPAGFKPPPAGFIPPTAKAPPVLPTASKWRGMPPPQPAPLKAGPPPKVRPPGVGPTPTKPPPPVPKGALPSADEPTPHRTGGSLLSTSNP